MRSWAAAMIAAVVLCGCVKQGLSRDELERRYVDGLIEAGIDATTADCVMTKFFDQFSDPELKKFNKDGTSLTDAQQQRIGELTAECSSS